MYVHRSPLDPPVMLLGSRNFSPPANMPPRDDLKLPDDDNERLYALDVGSTSLSLL